jgi:uncharacterized membrane protein
MRNFFSPASIGRKPFVPRTPFWVFVGVSVLGFSDAAYLAAKYLQGVAPPCTVLSGCETVTLSAYAEIAGIPVSLLGALYYAGLFLLSLIAWETGKRFFFFLATRATIIGFLMSLYFVFLQLVVLRAFCAYCMFSAVTSTALFVIGLLVYVQDEREREWWGSRFLNRFWRR